MPPLPADSIHARACKLKCEKILTRPPGAGAQRAAQTKKQLRRSVRIYREVKDKAGRNGLPCPFYTV